MTRLGAVAELRIGRTPSRAEAAYWATSATSGHPWAAIRDLSRGVVATTAERITPLAVERTGMRPVRAGTLLMSFKLTVGRMAIAGCELFTNEAIVAIEPGRSVSGGYLRHFLATADFASASDQAVKGATLNKGKLARFPVVLPPPLEQRAIAATLDAIDDAINRTTVMIAATEKLRQALLHELLTRGLPGRHTHWKDVAELGTVPACWDSVRLESLFEILDARRSPLNADERANMTGEYPYYGANGLVDHINRWIFDEDDALVLLAEDGGHFDEFRTRPIAYRVRGKCWVNNHAHVLKATHRALSSFLFHSLANKDVGAFVNGSTRSKLTQADLRRVEIGLPALDEARLIGAALDSLEVSRDSLTEESESMVNMRISAADALLTGRVRLPTSEAAAV